MSFEDNSRRVRRQLPPITQEQAVAKETEYNQSKHHPPVVLATTKKYSQVKWLWEEFLQHIHDDAVPLQRLENIPTPGRLKMFMEWIFETSVGILADRITLKTLKNTWFSFRAMYQRETDNVMPVQLGTDVLCFIKTDLREKGLAKIRREKVLADNLDMAWALTYLWCYDTYEFRHPRYRVQLTLILLLIVYAGPRPGTIIESSAYRGSNQAMRYTDFELIGLPIGPGESLELTLKVRFRYEKGNRDQGGNDNDDFKWVTFREDRSCRGRCPVTHFLGLAFADEIFADLRSESDLVHLRSPGTNRCVPIKFRETKLNMLIFRHCNKDNTIAPDTAMNYNDLARALAELGIRLGFRDILKPYNLRRGAANAFDGNSEVSPNQYSQLLGHSVRVMGANYISNISAIDVQGIINKETLRQDHIQMLRSMRIHLNPNAPTRLPFLENQTVLDHPELIEINEHLKTLEKRLRTEGENSTLRQQYIKATWLRKRRFAQLYQRACADYRNNAFEVANSNMVRKMIEDGEAGITNEEEKTPFDIPTMKFVSSTHFPDRHSIASQLWTQNPRYDCLPDSTLVQSLKNLCKPEEYILYYPNEMPVNGCCPVCKLDMTKVRGCQRTDHIHKCVGKTYKDISQEKFDCFPLQHCKWDDCNVAFVQKPTYSLDFANDVSDAEQRRHLKAKESKQLNDLRRTGTNLNINAKPLTRKATSAHLKRHLICQTLCLWDSCGFQCTSGEDLLRHLWVSHKVTIKQAAFEPKFCFEHPDNGWFIDEFDWEDHCKTHLAISRRILNFQSSYHMFTAGLQCPFCLSAHHKSSDRLTQFTNRGTFNRHLDTHQERSLRCPVPLCTEDLFNNPLELQIHFFDVHELSPKGFTQSHGFHKLRSNDTNEDNGIKEDEIFDWESEGSENEWLSCGDNDAMPLKRNMSTSEGSCNKRARI